MPSVPPPLVRAADAAMEASVVLSFSRIGYEVRSRLEGWPDADELPGERRHVLVTGGNSGLGYATTRRLTAAGADVRFTVRSEEKGEATLEQLREDLGETTAAGATYELLDLGDLDSVRDLAARLDDEDVALDTLVHNAGALFDERGETVDGLERTYQIHVVAPFLLTALLLPRLRSSATPGRVVTVTSGGMYAQKLDTRTVDSPDRYRGTTAYARAKRAQVTLTSEWSRRFSSPDLGFHVAHPGWALTPGIERSLPGFRRLTGPVLRAPNQGADTVVHLVLADELPTDGRLWHDRRPRREHKVPWTRAERGEAGQLWARVSRDAGIDPGA